MLKSRHIDRIAIATMAIAVVVSLLFINGEALGLRSIDRNPAYATRLFDAAKVHDIDILIDDWDDLIERAEEKQYRPVSLIIDGERFDHVGLRVKGHSSLRVTKKYGHRRFSLKVEFDHYIKGQSYHGLDKLSLDASFQDNSYMKTPVAFELMRQMEVPASLWSYSWIRVNGEDWGLYIALEEPEHAFARRNWGRQHGRLYKPGYRSLRDENADVQLRYSDDDPASYDNIFRSARFPVSKADKPRLIEALRILSTGRARARARRRRGAALLRRPGLRRQFRQLPRAHRAQLLPL